MNATAAQRVRTALDYAAAYTEQAEAETDPRDAYMLARAAEDCAAAAATIIDGAEYAAGKKLPALRRGFRATAAATGRAAMDAARAARAAGVWGNMTTDDYAATTARDVALHLLKDAATWTADTMRAANAARA